jgi:hypothetical protein
MADSTGRHLDEHILLARNGLVHFEKLERSLGLIEPAKPIQYHRFHGPSPQVTGS